MSSFRLCPSLFFYDFFDRYDQCRTQQQIRGLLFGEANVSEDIATSVFDLNVSARLA